MDHLGELSSTSKNMSSRYEELIRQLPLSPKTWLVTGVAGFIGSNLLETLLKLNQRVIGLDNFSTGHRYNLEEVRQSVDEQQWKRFTFVQGDIRTLDDCRKACENVDYVLHQAALGSVPRSINDPLTTNAVNITGFLNMLIAARDAKVQSFTYAASSSTYGDHPDLPKREEKIGAPLSPYAITKYVNELYADVFSRCYSFSTVGLRYFNVFGPRQDPNGAYAAVIPRWISAMIRDKDVFINGDGETSRDFCFIKNAVQANLLAATNTDPRANRQVYNIAVGERTTLNQLFLAIKQCLSANGINYNREPKYQDFRDGDVRHSQADIRKASNYLMYSADFNIHAGVSLTVPWYIQRHRTNTEIKG